MAILCVVHFQEPVLSEKNILATAADINLSFPARCFFPGPHPAQVGLPSRRLEAPPDSWTRDKWPEADWGLVNSDRVVTIKALGVKLDHLDLDHLDIDEVARIDRELNAWAARLHGWISVLMRGPSTYMFDIGGVSWPWDVQQEMQSNAYADGRMYEPQELTEWQWRHAFEHVTVGDPAPPNRTLLARAIMQANTENYRSAVLDSATSVELTLVSAIERWGRDHGSEGRVTELLLKGKTLGGLIELASGLSIPVPNDTRRSLVEARNRVMHRGYTPGGDEASAAIRVAEAIVSSLDPFPSHCDEDSVYLTSPEGWEDPDRDSGAGG